MQDPTRLKRRIRGGSTHAFFIDLEQMMPSELTDVQTWSKQMAFIHQTISSAVLALGFVTALSTLGPALAQAPILHGGVGRVGGGVARPAIGAGVRRPAIGAGIGRPGFAPGIGRPGFAPHIGRPGFAGGTRPNFSAGIVRPHFNPGVARPFGIGRVGGRHGGVYGGGFRPYYHRHFHGRNYGFYPIVPFGYPYFVPEYSYGWPYYGEPYYGYGCRVHWVKVRVRVRHHHHHHYRWRWVRRRICY